MRIFYCAEAIDNLVISQNHVVTFGNETLDYIPGSVILGALAAKVYSNSDKYSDEQLFSLFQNNNHNIFSNAYPIGTFDNETLLSLPTPLCIHYQKNKNDDVENYINKIVDDPNDHEQYKQVRSGYLTSNFKKIKFKTGVITRTAIEFKTQSAEKNQLFSQKYISKGTQFVGFIEFEEQFTPLIDEFLDGKFIRIGKSRSSEFGRVKLQKINQRLSLNKPSDISNYLYLWMISDCQFYDLTTGQPSLVPQASNIWTLFNPNKPSGDIKLEFDEEKSFIRTSIKRYFNRKRGGFDGEKLLVNKGSVIAFRLNKSLSQQQMKDIQDQGIGLDRQLGFGQVIVNPSWINKKDISQVQLFEKIIIEIKADNNSSKEDCINPNLIKYLNNIREIRSKETSYKFDSKHQSFVIDLYNKIRSCNKKINVDIDFGPSSTQWEQIYSVVKNCKNWDECLKELYEIILKNIGSDRFINSTSDKKETSSTELNSWAAYLFKDSKRLTFAEEYFEYVSKEYNPDKDIKKYLYDLEKLVKHDYSKLSVLKKEN